MQRYDSYKDSGIQWLGEIPSHWEVCKIKNVSQISSGSTPKSSIEKYWGGGIKWITPADFKTDTKYVCKGMRNITEVGALSCSTKLIPKNSVVFSKRAPVGQVSITTDDLCINQGCIACIPNESIITPFFFYLLSCYKNEFESLSGGTTFKEIALNVFADFKISIPPLPEQQAIASYLDTATAKIDEAIAQQQKMIDLLNERKQIIINNAVTKGLNPNAKMKPSGIDWIGEIPEHWEVGRLKTIMSIQRGHDLTAEQFQKGSIPVYGSGGRMGYHNCATSKSPSIVIGRSGSVGKLHFVETDFWAHNTAIYLKDNKGNDVKYLFYLLSSINLASLATQTAVPTLDRKNVLDYMFTFTRDINEQKQIVTFIENSIKHIDQANSNATKQITLLQERKQIIINDVVTGKVKVV